MATELDGILASVEEEIRCRELCFHSVTQRICDLEALVDTQVEAAGPLPPPELVPEGGKDLDGKATTLSSRQHESGSPPTEQSARAGGEMMSSLKRVPVSAGRLPAPERCSDEEAAARTRVTMASLARSRSAEGAEVATPCDVGPPAEAAGPLPGPDSAVVTEDAMASGATSSSTPVRQTKDCRQAASGTTRDAGSPVIVAIASGASLQSESAGRKHAGANNRLAGTTKGGFVGAALFAAAAASKKASYVAGPDGDAMTASTASGFASARGRQNFVKTTKYRSSPKLESSVGRCEAQATLTRKSMTSTSLATPVDQNAATGGAFLAAARVGTPLVRKSSAPPTSTLRQPAAVPRGGVVHRTVVRCASPEVRATSVQPMGHLQNVGTPNAVQRSISSYGTRVTLGGHETRRCVSSVSRAGSPTTPRPHVATFSPLEAHRNSPTSYTMPNGAHLLSGLSPRAPSPMPVPLTFARDHSPHRSPSAGLRAAFPVDASPMSGNLQQRPIAQLGPRVAMATPPAPARPMHVPAAAAAGPPPMYSPAAPRGSRFVLVTSPPTPADAMSPRAVCAASPGCRSTAVPARSSSPKRLLGL